MRVVGGWAIYSGIRAVLIWEQTEQTIALLPVENLLCNYCGFLKVEWRGHGFREKDFCILQKFRGSLLEGAESVSLNLHRVAV